MVHLYFHYRYSMNSENINDKYMSSPLVPWTHSHLNHAFPVGDIEKEHDAH